MTKAESTLSRTDSRTSSQSATESNEVDTSSASVSPMSTSERDYSCANESHGKSHVITRRRIVRSLKRLRKKTLRRASMYRQIVSSTSETSSSASSNGIISESLMFTINTTANIPFSTSVMDMTVAASTLSRTDSRTSSQSATSKLIPAAQV